MAEELSISDAEKQFEDACDALYAAEAERDRLVLALSRQQRVVKRAEEAKKKASDVLNSLGSDPPSSEDIGAAHGDNDDDDEEEEDHARSNIQVGRTIVGKDFLLPQGDETKLFREGVETISGSLVKFYDEGRVLFGIFVSFLLGGEGELLGLALEGDRDLVLGDDVDDFWALNEHCKYVADV